MKAGHTQIVVILDRSGSMDSVKQATIDGFNEFVNGQKQAGGTADLRLVQFDDKYEVVFDKPLAEVPKLDGTTFVPRGSTALHDAIGRTVSELGAQLGAKPEADRPESVIVVTLTDGCENASKEYTREKIADIVKHQREKYDWDFIFLGANQDAVLTAKGFNIPATSALSYNSNAHSVTAMSASMGAYTTSLRTSAPVRALARKKGFSDEDRKKAKQ